MQDLTNYAFGDVYRRIIYIYIYIYKLIKIMKLKNKLKLTFISLYMRNIYCKDKSPKLYIGPWALADDFDWSEDE